MNEQRTGSADILALGFGTTTAIWALAYILRLPALNAPVLAVTIVIAATLIAGGYNAGRYTRRGWIGGALVGLTSGLLNLLILGAALGGGNPDAMRTLPVFAVASLLISAVLALLGAAFGTTRRARTAEVPAWSNVFARVAVAATLLLLIAGGLVTSYEAGMAVFDWPTSFGYNMFLLPLSQMTDHKVFLEHAHRLLGSLVGFTVLTLAIHLSLARISRAATLLAWGIAIAVALQAVLGGFRVIKDAATLGMVHGALAQIILAATVALAIITLPAWLSRARAKQTDAAGMEHSLPLVLLIFMLIQLGIGVYMRHFQAEQLAMLHITVAVFVLALAIWAGARASSVYPDVPVIRKSGKGLIHLAGLQVLLGGVALALGAPETRDPSIVQALAATAHQANAALLLAATARLLLWNRRLLSLPVVEAATSPRQSRASRG